MKTKDKLREIIPVIKLAFYIMTNEKQNKITDIILDTEHQAIPHKNIPYTFLLIKLKPVGNHKA